MALDRTERRMIAAYNAGDYESALQVVLDAAESVSDTDFSTIEFWQVCLFTRTGRTDDAIRVMGRVVERGGWFGHSMLQDEDLDPLRNDPRWQGLVATCERREHAAVPPPHMFRPSNSEPVGTVIALHAAGGSGSHATRAWHPATSMGYDLFAPGGTIVTSHDRWTWGSIEQVEADLFDRIASLSAPLVFAGRSRGAVLAAQLAERTDRVRGVILVAHAPSPDSCSALDVPTFLVSGAEDQRPFLDAVDTFASYQSSRGIPTVCERIDGAGHSYPADFEQILSRAIHWISSSG